MQGYQDPRYFAGLKKLVPVAYDRELKHITDTNRTAYEAARQLAEQPNFSVSFDDPQYGLSWWAHARFHGLVKGRYDDRPLRKP